MFSGSCLSHPIRPDVRGTLATIASIDDIVDQAIIDVLETRQGERVMVPGYGIPDFVFNVAGFAFAPRFAYFAERQILDYVPLVEKVKVTSGEQTDDGFVEGLAVGRVALNVWRKVRGSNTPRNLVFPVWQLAN